jgi:hypothetical protein
MFSLGIRNPPPATIRCASVAFSFVTYLLLLELVKAEAEGMLATESSLNLAGLSATGVSPLTPSPAVDYHQARKLSGTKTPATKAKIAAIYFARELGMTLPPSSLSDERDLVTSIISAETCPEPLFQFYTILKIRTTLPEFLPILLDVVQDTAALGSAKAQKTLARLLPLLAVQGAPEEWSPHKAPAVVENAGSALEAIQLACAYLALGVPLKGEFQAVIRPRVTEVCKNVEKWDLDMGTFITIWALDEHRRGIHANRRSLGLSNGSVYSPFVIVPTPHKDPNATGSGFASSPDASTTAASPLNDHSPQSLAVDSLDVSSPIRLAGVLPTVGNSAAVGTDANSSTVLGFPDKLPAKPLHQSAAVVLPLVMTCWDLAPDSAPTLAMWCLRAVNDQVYPLAATGALACLLGSAPASCKKLTIGNVRFAELVLVGSLRASLALGAKAREVVPQGGVVSASSPSSTQPPNTPTLSTLEYIWGVPALLKTAVLAAQLGEGAPFSKAAQLEVVAAIKHYTYWYRSSVNVLRSQPLKLCGGRRRAGADGNPSAECPLTEADLKQPLRLVLRVADVMLHDYKAGTPEFLRHGLHPLRPMFEVLSVDETLVDILETMLAATEVPVGTQVLSSVEIEKEKERAGGSDPTSISKSSAGSSAMDPWRASLLGQLPCSAEPLLFGKLSNETILWHLQCLEREVTHRWLNAAALASSNGSHLVRSVERPAYIAEPFPELF